MTAQPLRRTRKKNIVTTSTATRSEPPATNTAFTPSPSKALGHTHPGYVSFVGAGPGDASLLTVRAAELLAEADVVITELPEQAMLVTNDAKIVDGGFSEDGSILTHAARARLVVKHAKAGSHVVRLLAGDPLSLIHISEPTRPY